VTRQAFLEALRGLSATSKSYRGAIDAFLQGASHRETMLLELLQVKMVEVEILISRLVVK
jgi:hypothetical protein